MTQAIEKANAVSIWERDIPICTKYAFKKDWLMMMISEQQDPHPRQKLQFLMTGPVLLYAGWTISFGIRFSLSPIPPNRKCVRPCGVVVAVKC